MAPPWAENQLKVVVEFRRASGCFTRKIEVTHKADRLPPQLTGRCSPSAWALFMNDVNLLAAQHPSMERANVGCCLTNCIGLLQVLTFGFGCFQGDAGDYTEWGRKVTQVMQSHSHSFPGSAMMLKEAQNSYFIQIDLCPQPNMVYQAPVVMGYPQAPQGKI